MTSIHYYELGTMLLQSPSFWWTAGMVDSDGRRILTEERLVRWWTLDAAGNLDVAASDETRPPGAARMNILPSGEEDRNTPWFQEENHRHPDGGVHFFGTLREAQKYLGSEEAVPWLEDPSTQRGVLELIRSKYGDPLVCLAYTHTNSGPWWMVSRDNGSSEILIYGMAENPATALVEALVAGESD